jgi:hypothetical protein
MVEKCVLLPPAGERRSTVHTSPFPERAFAEPMPQIISSHHLKSILDLSVEVWGPGLEGEVSHVRQPHLGRPLLQEGRRGSHKGRL